MGKYDLLTRHLARAVETRPAKPSLLELFFPVVDVHGENIVEFDKKDYQNSIAPFVAPSINGNPIEVEGFDNKILKLPTMKPSGAITNEDLNKKPFGRTVYDARAKNARARDLVNSKVMDNEDRIDVRLEAMRADALFNGSITVVGEGYDSVITFGRTESHTIDLGAGNYWDEGTATPASDIDAFLELLAESGASGTHIIGRPAVVSKLVDFVKEETDFRRANNGELRFQSMLTINGAIYYGTYKNVEIWGYSGAYKDNAGSTAYMIPDKKIIMVSAQNQNEMSFGYAGDVEIELDIADDYTVSPRNVITKLIGNRTTVEIESILTAAPLLKDPDSTLVATVIS